MVDYSLHVPQCGYTKIWPTEVWCPVCRKWSIVRRSQPMYIPKPRTKAGDKVVIYVCSSCYNKYAKLNYLTVDELMEKTNALRTKRS